MTLHYRKVYGMKKNSNPNVETGLAQYDSKPWNKHKNKYNNNYKHNGGGYNNNHGGGHNKHNNNNRSKNKFKGTCHVCGRLGHKAKDCWQNSTNRKNNKGRQPGWFQGRQNTETNQANVNTGGNISEGTEVQMVHTTSNEVISVNAGISFPNDMSILNDPNIWVLDTAATTGATKHLEGSINHKQPAKSEHTIFGNSSLGRPKKYIDVPVTVCDNQGMELYDACFKDVQHNPDAPFNLYPGLKLYKEGWSYNGSKQDGGISLVSPDGNIQ